MFDLFWSFIGENIKQNELLKILKAKPSNDVMPMPSASRAIFQERSLFE
jgi:hypothetical protein